MAYLRSKSEIINLSASAPMFGGVTVHQDIPLEGVSTILSTSATIYRVKYDLNYPDIGAGYNFWQLQFSANAEACRDSSGIMNTIRATVFLYYSGSLDMKRCLTGDMLPNCSFQLYCVAVCE